MSGLESSMCVDVCVCVKIERKGEKSLSVFGLNVLAPLETKALETINCRATIKTVC